MKKNLKITLATVTMLASAALAPAMPVFAADTPAATAVSTNAVKTATTDSTQTVSMTITQTGSTKPSEAGLFLGKSAKLVMKDGKIDQVIIHVDGSTTPMAKGQDMSKLITKLSINGVDGKQENISADGSALDFVFPAAAYKEGKGDLAVALNVMNRTMNEKADITFGALTNTDTTKQETAQTTSVKNDTKKAKGVKRTLKHNAYEYKKNGKRANKKVLKKGKKVTTYGHAIKLHGKTFYRISNDTYVKKANF